MVKIHQLLTVGGRALGWGEAVSPLVSPHKISGKPLKTLNKKFDGGHWGDKNCEGRGRGLVRGFYIILSKRLKKGKRIYLPPTAPQLCYNKKNKLGNYIIIKENIYLYLIQRWGDLIGGKVGASWGEALKVKKDWKLLTRWIGE